MLDLDHPNWLPLNDPVNQLVHAEDGTAVDSVMIGGRMVVENRRVLTVDLARLRDRAEAARDRLAGAQRRQPPPLRGAGAGRRQLLPRPRRARRITSTATARTLVGLRSARTRGAGESECPRRYTVHQ